MSDLCSVCLLRRENKTAGRVFIQLLGVGRRQLINKEFRVFGFNNGH